MSSCGEVQHATRKRGQAITEYVVITAIIAIGLIFTTAFVGKLSLEVLARLGAAMKNDKVEPDKTGLNEAIAGIEADAAITRNMRNFDGSDAGSSDSDSSSSEPPPSPSPAQEYSGIHHLGDDGAGGDGVMNEGLSYDISFALTSEMVDYANYADGGAMFLSFHAGDNPGQNDIINNPGVNLVLLDGQVVGSAQNGQNSIALNVGSLGPGTHTVTFTSGQLNTTHDDFSVSGIRIGHAGQ